MTAVRHIVRPAVRLTALAVTLLAGLVAVALYRIRTIRRTTLAASAR
jgi:hypothetical protein